VTGDFFLRLRPADLLNFSFASLLIAVTAAFHEKINDPWSLIAVYSSIIVIQVVLERVKGKGGVVRFTYDLGFPVFSILVMFESLEKIVHHINPRDIDPLLIRLDYMLFGGYPTVMLEKIMSPLLTDILQVAYTSYYFLPITLGVVLMIKKENRSFEHSLFMIMLCFYLSYIGYMVTPALGPRYTMHHLQERELEGLFLAGPVQHLLNFLEGIKRDAFPSGHTGVALTVLYLAFLHEKKLFGIFLPVTAALIFSTVYCRYHYVVDVVAGIGLAVITILLGETYYGYRSKRIYSDH
jgi:membrane-associated phospholipid phosphatase